MTKFKKKKKYRISKVVILDMALIFFFTYILFIGYSKFVSNRLIDIAHVKLNEFMDYFLSNKVNYDLFKGDNLKDIIIINKNSDGEILYVSYDMDKSYKVLDLVTKELENNINDLENGNVGNTQNISGGKNGILLKLPMFIGNNAIISNLGPKIYVPINFVGSILTNLKTKITDYGINNALVEIYVTVKLSTNIISPISSKEMVIDYDALIASVVVNGRVPSIYGGLIQSKSSGLSIPIS